MLADINKKLFIPRSEYQVFPLELPPLSKKEKEQAVQNKLRALYPGKLEDKYIVIRPNGKRGSYLVFVFNDSMRNDPLTISTLAACKLCRKGRRNCVIAFDNWIEYLVLEDGRVLSSLVTFIAGRLEDQLADNVEIWFDSSEYSQTETTPKKNLVEVFCAADDCPDGLLNETESFIIKYTSLEKALVPFPRYSWSCFPDRLKQVKLRRRVYAVSAFVFAVILAFCIRNWHEKKDAEKAAQREASRLAALEAAAQRALEERLSNLKEAWERQLLEQRVGVYATMETLASCLSPAIRLSSASMKDDGSFRLEGNSIDAIKALKSLQDHPEIQSADIGTIVMDEGTERFTANGVVKQRLLSPGNNLTDIEKITWYEDAMSDSWRSEAAPETAAAAAEQIRELLKKHRLAFTRFRYLEAHGGWAIECTLSGTAVQFVQALKEVDESAPYTSMSITGLETRNRQNGLDGVLTFFVRGPGENNQSREYDEHPSVAKIAMLYGMPQVRPAVPEQPQQMAEIKVIETNPTESEYFGTLEYVGFIEASDGRHHIYIKDTDTGELFRLTEGNGNYSYTIDGSGTIIARLDGFSNSIEVRRNDGF